MHCGSEKVVHNRLVFHVLEPRLLLSHMVLGSQQVIPESSETRS